ncbi:hypothetical protein [Ideonella sp.]|uniref:hypothetical protein n=1 Tax=Ideonella sp. TaxID=1929293 RepID=UPI0035AEABB8
MATALPRHLLANMSNDADMGASPGGSAGSLSGAGSGGDKGSGMGGSGMGMSGGMAGAGGAGAMAGDPRFERVVSGAHEAVDSAAESLAQAAEQLRHKASRMAELEREYMEAARGCVRDHPMASVAAAAAIGWLIGRMSR